MGRQIIGACDHFTRPVTFREVECYRGINFFKSMKTLPLVAFLAALGAFLFSPLNFEVAVSMLLTLGVASILTTDYRERRPLVAMASVPAPTKRSALPLAV